MNGTNSYQLSNKQLIGPVISRLRKLEQSVKIVDNITEMEIKEEFPLLEENDDFEGTKESIDQESSFQAQILAELRKINQRLDNVESILLGQSPIISRTPKKPSVLPLTTTNEVLQFNNANEETYQSVVQYLAYLGGSAIRESVNLCMKEVFAGSCVSQFTWMGKDTGRHPVGLPLYNTRLARAIFEATSMNRHYSTPTKTEFASNMKEALRVVKQRTRNQLLNKKRRATDDEEDF